VFDSSVYANLRVEKSFSLFPRKLSCRTLNGSMFCNMLPSKSTFVKLLYWGKTSSPLQLVGKLRQLRLEQRQKLQHGFTWQLFCVASVPTGSVPALIEKPYPYCVKPAIPSPPSVTLVTL
jgi:hypothetical protein